ncbi:SPOR domain-containing protein [Porticoccus sp. W117]|uniref:SPOR domain-containing protein n=1 Tax=Porticoccus sp. W117 TaxID=3054777 RepID=UPI00259610F0|nr:SPOR domain-containing protein [Porticoccus sp. W117]MDM3871673.1 SPOR domain-containing protein [Porticoccus sp. W117]
MNDGLKQRVVGAFVLAALAIIFLPMLFDFSGERYIDRNSYIPSRPDISSRPFEEPARPDNIQYPKPAERIFQPDDSEPLVEQPESDTEEPAVAVEETTPAPGLNEQGMLAAWVIQVGAFSDKQRAAKLEQSLLADGYKAYLRENPSRGLFFVYVGPDADKQTLQRVQKKVDSKYRLKSKILSFEP